MTDEAQERTEPFEPEVSGARIPRARERFWILWLCSICVLGLLIGITYNIDPKNSFASDIEYSLSTTVLFGAMFYALIGRHVGRLASWLPFVAVFISCMLGGAIHASSRHASNVLLLKRTQDELRHIGDFVGEFPSTPSRLEATASTAAKDFSRIVLHYAGLGVQLRRAYLADLSGLGWDTVLAASHMTNDIHFADRLATADRALELVKAYRLKYAVLAADLDSEISSASFGDTTKPFLHRYLPALTLGGPPDSIGLLEQKIGLQIRKLLVFMSDHRQGWTVHDSSVTFRSDDEHRQFSADLDSLQILKDLQSGLATRSQQEAARAIDAFVKSMD